MDSNEEDASLNPLQSTSDLITSLHSTLTQSINLSDTLPSLSELKFEKTLSRSLNSSLIETSTSVFDLVQSILTNLDPTSASGSKVELDLDLLSSGYYNQIQTILDTILESVDSLLDPSKPSPFSLTTPFTSTSNTSSATPAKLPQSILNPNLSKPQLLFQPLSIVPIPSIDSTELPLWSPILRYKFPLLLSASSSGSESVEEKYKPTLESYEPNDPHPNSTTPKDPPRIRFAHPFKEEMTGLKAPDSYFVKPVLSTISVTEGEEGKGEEGRDESFSTIPFSYISTVEEFEIMLNEIREVGTKADSNEGVGKELAIDLEHHSNRSWSGLTCLIQLSTREKDYILDPLMPDLRVELERLNEFFCDKDWIKVFHGANSDIIWLQRDFGLYIVGLFDTYHATHLLDFPQHSLLSLLIRYTSFVPDKRYQLADWRIRPLPEAMLNYARSDTHFLLYIYDQLRISLLELPTPKPTTTVDKTTGEEVIITDPSPLEEVFNRSIITSLAVFEILPYTPETGLHKGWRTIISKWHHANSYELALAVPTLPNKSGWGPGEIKLEVLKTLHFWREDFSRKEDENPEYVLSNKVLEELVRKIPRTEEEVLGVVGKTWGGITELVRKHKREILEAILKGLENVTVNPSQTSLNSEGEEELSEVVVGKGTGKEVEEGRIEPEVKALKGIWDETEVSAEEEKEVAAVVTTVVKSTASSMFGKKKKKELTSSTPSTATSTSSSEIPLVPSVIKPTSTTTTSIFARTSAFLTGKNKKKKTTIDAPTLEVVEMEVEEVPESILLANEKKDKIKELEEEKKQKKKDLVAKIHAGLILGGGLGDSLKSQSIPEALPLAIPVTASTSTETKQGEEAKEDISMDHSYVPFSDRMTKPATSISTSTSTPASVTSNNKKSDIIIVSNLTDKPKKRKRNQIQPSLPSGEGEEVDDELMLLGFDMPRLPPLASGSGSGTHLSPSKERNSKKPKKEKKSKEEQTEEKEVLEPHDYSTSKSILDASPYESGKKAFTKKDKKKEGEAGAGGGKRKGFEIDVSGFRKQPRVNNSSKKGNVSASFQK